MKRNCNNTCEKCSQYNQQGGSPCVNCDGENECVSVISSDCVIFNNDSLSCYGIFKGDSLTDVLLILLQFVFPECHTTTTTTLPPVCEFIGGTAIVVCPTTTTTTKYTLCDVCP